MGLRNVGTPYILIPHFTHETKPWRDPLISNRFEKAFISLSSHAGHK